jgi:hypothetical protein
MQQDAEIQHYNIIAVLPTEELIFSCGLFKELNFLDIGCEMVCLNCGKCAKNNGFVLYPGPN